MSESSSVTAVTAAFREAAERDCRVAKHVSLPTEPSGIVTEADGRMKLRYDISSAAGLLPHVPVLIAGLQQRLRSFDAEITSAVRPDGARVIEVAIDQRRVEEQQAKLRAWWQRKQVQLFQATTLVMLAVAAFFILRAALST
jgi:hypothetical protein